MVRPWDSEFKGRGSIPTGTWVVPEAPHNAGFKSRPPLLHPGMIRKEFVVFISLERLNSKYKYQF